MIPRAGQCVATPNVTNIIAGGGGGAETPKTRAACKKRLYGQTPQRTRSLVIARAGVHTHAARASRLLSGFRKDPSDVLFSARLKNLF